ncbi:MAG: GNAT family N-acetyltransferase [Oscillospiraceae bacterium]|nr:GNAT family N-acetyltransferase [Oscillospiraceae bacterium]
MTIRPYESKDRDNVRFVCLNSEGPCDMDEKGQHFILTTYCDYFIEKEPQNCFVAANENDDAVGYIICAESYDPYRLVFIDEYVERIDEADIGHRQGALNSTVLQNKYKNEYPAHLHIDLLPEYQRMGLGSKLVDTLCAHLKGKGIPGVMLTVGSQNNVGQSFYKKYGFTVLEESPGDVAFGIKL